MGGNLFDRVERHVRETLDFKSSVYVAKIKDWSDKRLKAKWNTERAKLNASAFGVGAAAAAVVPTSGVTLIPLFYSFRKCTISIQKIKHMDDERKSRNIGPWRNRKRNFIIPALVGMATMGILADLAGVMGHAGSAAVSHVANHGVTHAVAETAQEANSPSAMTTIHGFGHGVEQSIQAIVDPNSTVFTGPVTGHVQSFATGQAAGIDLVSHGVPALAQHSMSGGIWAMERKMVSKEASGISEKSAL